MSLTLKLGKKGYYAKVSNSTVACTLAAAKLGIKTAYLKAGFRSFDRTMPEEINRILTDAIADYLWALSRCR